MKPKLLFLLAVSFITITYSQNGFEEHVIFENPLTTNEPQSVYAADIDNDGDMDMISASSEDNKIAWYENIDEQGTFGIQQIVTTDLENASSVCTADIDGDGDKDVIATSGISYNGKITWYENTDGQGAFGSQNIIATNTYGNSVYATDFNGDGYIDIIVGNNDIIWYENTDGQGNFSEEIIISTYTAYSVHATDIDEDGDMDVISANSGDSIGWIENIDGQGTFGSIQIITTSVDSAKSVYASDIDGDGDNDVLSASFSDDKIAWYENTDGVGTFGRQQVITTNAYRASSVFSADIDNDGDMDVISASEWHDKIAWYENMDGLGSFGIEQIISTIADQAVSVYATDINGDTYMDVLSASVYDDKIAWYKNTDGLGSFGVQQVISIPADETRAVHSADIDGDGDMDVLSASSGDNKIAWYKNIDGQGSFSSQLIITTNAEGAKSVYTSDLDGDGDMDVISASDNNVAWQENIDGQGSFGVQQIISYNPTSEHAKAVHATDIDGDGDMDVLYASGNSNILWAKNTDGLGNFSVEPIIGNMTNIQDIYAIDIDGDGDMDVLGANATVSRIAWFENIDGLGSFGSMRIIANDMSRAYSVHAADIDGDGDYDVLSASSHPLYSINWHENTDGIGNFNPLQIISSDAYIGKSVYTADMDGDGDLDALSASMWDDKIAWYKNTDGLGSFGPQQIITTDADGALSVYAVDINGDGNMDVLSASYYDAKVSWYENLGNLNVQQNSFLSFSIFPNPTTGILNVQSETNISSITIYNQLGQLVLSNANKNEINISKLSQGLYFIKVKDLDGNFGVQKIIRE